MGWFGKLLLTALGLFLAFLAFGFYVGSTPEGKERQVKKDAIAECRKQQADDLASINTRRFVRDTCDAMEKKYREAYGTSP